MSSTEEKIRRRINLFLKKHKIRRDAPVLVGFSGGPDSAALVSLFLSLHRDGNLILAYLDHGLRPEEERAEEMRVVKSFAGERELKLHTGAVAAGVIAAEAARQGASVEDIARRYRYAFLRETADTFGCSYIALGHNLDDQLETVAARVCQGSGPDGLKGIPEHRDGIIRPLLGVRKKDILTYLHSKGLNYSVDSTNTSGNYLRNRVRRQVLPVLEEVFPGLEKTFGDLAEKMALTADFIRRASADTLIWESCEGGYRINRENFISAHPVLRLQSLYDLYDRCNAGEGPSRLPYGALRPAVNYRGEGEGDILKWHSITLSARGRYIFWKEDVVFARKKQYVIVVDKDTDFAVDTQLFHVRLCDTVSHECRYNIQASAPPVIIRSKRDGDRLRLGEGRIELNKLFSQWKVLPAHRGLVPVLEDREGIVAVLGEHLGYANRYRAPAFGDAPKRVYRIQIEVTADKQYARRRQE